MRCHVSHTFVRLLSRLQSLVRLAELAEKKFRGRAAACFRRGVEQMTARVVSQARAEFLPASLAERLQYREDPRSIAVLGSMNPPQVEWTPLQAEAQGWHDAWEEEMEFLFGAEAQKYWAGRRPAGGK